MAYISEVVWLESDSIGDNQITFGKADRKCRIYGLALTFTDTVEVVFKDGPNNVLSGPMTFAAGVPFVLDRGSQPWYVTSLNQPFVINLSTACEVAGTVWYDYIP